ncbi:hypothetical protein [Streptomyces kronopolitis]|uniref:hypothetical protein n=1 Tax=Streptomyces kronopolitis TaxID=1612435 RepID=UPI003D9549F4
MTSHVRNAGHHAMSMIAALLAQQGVPSEPESHCPGYAGLTVPLPHGAAVWISEAPDGPPGCAAAEYHRGDTDGSGDPIALSEPEAPAAVAAAVAAVARTITANCSH